MRMFRGHSSQVWREALAAKGWPIEQATIMANYLVGITLDVPAWADMMDHAKALTRYDHTQDGMDESPVGDDLRRDDLVPPEG